MEEQEKKLDYIELLNHINRYHPTRLPSGMKNDPNVSGNEPKEVRFGLCETLGSLKLCRCCLSQTTDMAKQIGIGATLFLMSTKALAIFFFILFFLNIPVLIFYSGGVDHGKQESESIFDLFSKFTLGNVGTPGYSCGEVNLARMNLNSVGDYKLELSCGFGTLGPIIDVGLIKDKDHTCQKLSKTPQAYQDIEEKGGYLHETCNMYGKLFDATPDFRNLFKAPGINEDGLFEMGDMKDSDAQAYMDTCNPPEQLKNPESMFEMLYYCKCFGKTNCEIQIKTKGCTDGRGNSIPCDLQLEPLGKGKGKKVDGAEDAAAVETEDVSPEVIDKFFSDRKLSDNSNDYASECKTAIKTKRQQSCVNIASKVSKGQSDNQLTNCKSKQPSDFVEPTMLVFAQCKSDVMRLFGGTQYSASFKKTDLGWIVVFVDLFVIVVFFMFTSVLEGAQKDFV